MTDKIVIPVRLAETKETCGNCCKFNPKTKKCSQKTRCGGVIITDARLNACVNYAPKPKKIQTSKELEEINAALKILAKDVGCTECPLQKICSDMKQEICIRAEAKELLREINAEGEEAA